MHSSIAFLLKSMPSMQAPGHQRSLQWVLAGEEHLPYQERYSPAPQWFPQPNGGQNRTTSLRIERVELPLTSPEIVAGTCSKRTFASKMNVRDGGKQVFSSKATVHTCQHSLRWTLLVKWVINKHGSIQEVRPKPWKSIVPKSWDQSRLDHKTPSMRHGNSCLTISTSLYRRHKTGRKNARVVSIISQVSTTAMRMMPAAKSWGLESSQRWLGTSRNPGF